MDTWAFWSNETIMKKNHTIIIGCGGAGLLVFVGVLAALYLRRPQPPRPQAATPDETVEYLASEEFTRMGSDAKRQYIREIRVGESRTPVMTLLFRPNVPSDQRRRVMKNVLPVIGPVIDQRLDEFDRLAPAEQIARLDTIIDSLQETRRSHPEGMSSPELFSLILQYVDPHTRAKVREHIPALRARMKERGIRPGFPF
jgi:hypothetical protein